MAVPGVLGFGAGHAGTAGCLHTAGSGGRLPSPPGHPPPPRATREAAEPSGSGSSGDPRASPGATLSFAALYDLGSASCPPVGFAAVLAAGCAVPGMGVPAPRAMPVQGVPAARLLWDDSWRCREPTSRISGSLPGGPSAEGH